MMAVNRYRLRNLAKGGNRGARIAEKLLGKTDTLLATILLGNNLVNSAAAALVTVIAFRLFGESEWALTAATLTVTFLILVFSEVTPKVMGATYPEKITPWVSFVLAPLQKLLSPIIWFVNLFARGLLRVLHLPLPGTGKQNSMGVEELRILLAESGTFLPSHHRSILLNLFDLEKLTVDDAMLPRGDIEAIDLDGDDESIRQRIIASGHAHLPAYNGELNNVVGIVNVRRALARLRDDERHLDDLHEDMRAAYFIPSGTPLLTQLSHFQENRQSIGLVVDEYGELIGLVTVEDILEEIVGEFTGSMPLTGRGWVQQPDGSFLVDGAVNLRNLNRKLNLELPLDGPRTLNGLILEHLEAMPEPGVTIKIGRCAIEIMQLQERMVKTVRITLMGKPDARGEPVQH